MYDYYLLEDNENYGLLIRQHSQTLEETYYDARVSKWVECDLIMHYLVPENKYFGEYKILNEKEAIVYISRLMFMKFYDDGFAYPAI